MNHFQSIGKELQNADAMLILSDANCFYATGFQGEGACLVTKDEYFYFTDSRYTEAAEKLLGNHVVEFSSGKNFMTCVNQKIEELGIKTLAIEDEFVTIAQMKRLQSKITIPFAEGSTILKKLRASKDDNEIQTMIQAQRIAEKALDTILSYIEPGISEKEIAAKIQYELLINGAQKISFDPIVGSGPNSSMPHAVPTERKVQKGDFITMDFGCIYQGYCSDMTRTIALGSVSQEMKDIYSVVYEAQQAGIMAARAGQTGKSIDGAAREVIVKAGYGPYFGHSFGHSLGIEIHESPNASPNEETPMPNGAVISAEPGIYLPGKFGVRIEDVLILGENGCQDITKAPKELIIL